MFRPICGNIRNKYGISKDAYMVLGVAFDWGIRKGLDVFLELSSRLGAQYQIVLAGTNENIDKQLPDNIISIHRTENQYELAELYTTADVFVNPTREDNFPTVNIESIACGTPVVTFKTGGSPEVIDETCGCCIEKNDIEALTSKIIFVCNEKPYTKENCLKRAASFNMDDKFYEYICLYEGLL